MATPVTTVNGNSVSVKSAEQEAIRATGIAALSSLTPAQVMTWFDNNVTDIASARTAFKQLARITLRLDRDMTEVKAAIRLLQNK